MSTKYKIYKITRFDSKVIYVGMTGNAQRIAHHQRTLAWAIALGAPKGGAVSVIETVEGKKRTALRREAYWINRYKQSGHPLVNVKLGSAPADDALLVSVRVHKEVFEKVQKNSAQMGMSPSAYIRLCLGLV